MKQMRDDSRERAGDIARNLSLDVNEKMHDMGKKLTPKTTPKSRAKSEQNRPSENPSDKIISDFKNVWLTMTQHTHNGFSIFEFFIEKYLRPRIHAHTQHQIK